MSIYRITVQGELSERFASSFEGMTLEAGDGKTVLVGEVADQAQLQGLLSMLGGLGLALVAVNPVPTPEQPTDEQGARSTTR